jgi:DNA-binding transcriptional MerR regulator
LLVPPTSPTGDLIAQLLQDGREPDQAAVEVLRELLDDSTIEEDATPLGIAEAAALVGLTGNTLRYYEREGLITPSRTTAGHREYRSAELRRLVFLTRMRLSGMNMSDLKRYIQLVAQGDATVPERRDTVLAQQTRIRNDIRQLTLALETTEYKIRSYEGAPTD